MAGTGLPIPKSGDVLAQPAPVLDADKFSAAKSWLQIAAAGDRLAKEGGDLLKVEAQQRRVGYLADADVEIARRRADLRNQFDNDPNGFDNAWKAYSDGKLSEVESWAVPHLKRTLGAEGNGAYSGLLNQKRQTDTRLATESWGALADQAGNDVISAAMSGTLVPTGPKGEIADPTIIKLKGVLDSGVSSRFLSQEESDRRLLQITNRAAAEVTIKEIGDEYRRNRENGETAGPLALKAAEERILRSQNLALSEAQRYDYFRKATAEVRALEAERKQDLAMARSAAQDAHYALARGITLDPGAIDAIATQLDQAGGQADTARLRAAAARAESLGAFTKAPLVEQLRQYRVYTEATGATAPAPVRAAIDEAAAATGVPASYLYRAAGKESGFNPNAQARTSSAGGLFQFTDATWRTTLSRYGAKYGLSADTPKTDARANALMAGEFTRENGEALRAARLPVNDATLYLAHFAGARGAVKLLQADPNARAVGVLPGAASANQSIFYARDGSARSVGQVVSALTRGLGEADVAVAGHGADLRLVAGMQQHLDKTASDAWAAMSADLDKDIRPSAQALKTVMDAAAAAGDHNLLETIGARLDRFDTVADVGRTPVAQQQAVLTELQRQGELGALAPGAAAFARDVESRISATQNGLDNNAVNFTVGAFPERFKAPPPINPADAAAFQDGLSYRAGIVQFAAQNWQVSARSALYGADLATVRNTLESGSADQKLGIFRTMAETLPEPIYRATMEKLGNDTLTMFVGTLAQTRPELAREILRGVDLMKLDQTGDKGSLVRPAFQSVIGRDLYPSAADQNNVTQAALALYTARRGTAGALYDPTDTAGIEKAIEDVAGKITRLHGRKVAVPPGMTEATFNRTITRMSAAQFEQVGGAFDRNGKPFEPEFLSSHVVLTQMGPGDSNYLFALADPTARDGIAPILTQDGRPLVVDVTQMAPSTPLTPYQAGRAAYRAQLVERYQETRRQSMGIE